jgi:hypothetical protein
MRNQDRVLLGRQSAVFQNKSPVVNCLTSLYAHSALEECKKNNRNSEKEIIKVMCINGDGSK